MPAGTLALGNMVQTGTGQITISIDQEVGTAEVFIYTDPQRQDLLGNQVVRAPDTYSFTVDKPVYVRLAGTTGGAQSVTVSWPAQG